MMHAASRSTQQVAAIFFNSQLVWAKPLVQFCKRKFNQLILPRSCHWIWRRKMNLVQFPSRIFVFARHCFSFTSNWRLPVGPCADQKVKDSNYFTSSDPTYSIIGHVISHVLGYVIYLPFHLTFSLTYVLTFYLAFSLTSWKPTILESNKHIIVTFVWPWWYDISYMVLTCSDHIMWSPFAWHHFWYITVILFIHVNTNMAGPSPLFGQPTDRLCTWPTDTLQGSCGFWVPVDP